MSVAAYTPQTPHREYRAAADSPETYVPLPRRLMEDLRDAPVALGAYALLARIYQATGTPIALSPGDLERYDPALSYGAGRRALDRLVDDGYAVITDSSGRKLSYLPCWGKVDATPRPWDRAVPSWGRPRHIAAVRLDDRLLDVCMGRLRPHPNHPAVIERYVVTPLISLRAIGAYALALAGIPICGTALADLGLCDTNGRPLPLPDDAAILAAASQRGATNANGGLTLAGWQHAGFTLRTPARPTGQPLFFAPTGVIFEAEIRDVSGDMIGDVSGHLSGHLSGHMIGDMIGRSCGDETENSQLECSKAPLVEPPARSYGCTESDGTNVTTTTQTDTFASTAADGGGGAIITPEPRPDQLLPPLNESERLLRAIGVRADVAVTFAHRSGDQTRDVIAKARTQPGVRDLAAWVVSALRALPAAEEIAPAPPKASERVILFHRGISGYDRQRWLAIFRSADPVDRPAVLARFHAQHPEEESHVNAA
jgi:hypothetical protein